MKRDSILFAVPLYRESEDEYYSNLNKRDRISQERQKCVMKKFLGAAYRSDQVAADPPFPVSPRNAWKYNRIIGWIEFYSDRKTVKADLWLSKGKRPPPNFSSVTLEQKGKIADVCLAHAVDNSELRLAFAAFLENFEHCRYRVAGCQKLFVDKAALLRHLEFMDLKGLIDRIEGDRRHK
ncbi:MAG: hypothetical protein ABH852_02500 [Methanobacteriota archaeon]